MLYTGKGDDGTTSTFCSAARVSKSSKVAEGLGVLDELNSYLGLCKVSSTKENISVSSGVLFRDIVHDIQSNLFIVQSELACSDKTISKEKITDVEVFIEMIEKEMTPITTFIVSGGSELSAHLDYARTLVRRAERVIVGLSESNESKVGEHTLAYLNRLSSLLFALARLSNTKSGITEESPTYE